MCHDLDHRGTNNSFQTKYSISKIHWFSNFVLSKVLCGISVFVIRLCSHSLEGNWVLNALKIINKYMRSKLNLNQLKIIRLLY
jgi:hypothetical protein